MLKIINTALKAPILFILSVCWLLSACSHSGVNKTPVADKEGKVQRPLQRLAAMGWQLSSIKRGQNNPSDRIASGIPVNRYHLDFVDDHLRLRGGCNSVKSVVKITSPGKMQVGPMVMTNRGCNTKLMQADAEVGRTLSHVTHYRLDGRSLAMLGAKRILLFEGVPKPKKHASDGSANVRKANFW